jgi:hypothetical protein
MWSWLKKPIVGFAALVIALSAVGVYLATRSNNAAVASWSFRPESPVADAVTTFDARASTGDVPIRCLWEFENETGTILHTLPADGVATETACRTTFTFPNPGVKHVRLVAFDADDDTDKALKTLTLATAPTPTATPPPRDPQPTGIVFDGRITGNSTNPWNVQECNPNTDLTPMHDSTGWFVRARVSGPGDPCFGDSSWRAELMAPSTTKAGNILEGETWYYSFGVRFPAGFPTLENSHCSAAQWFGRGRQELGLGCSGANNPPPHTQVLAISSPPEGGWTAPLQKGRGWHMFVMKVLHHDDPAHGRLSLWYKPPGATRYSKVINNHATSTWNAPPGSMYHKIGYYRGAQDPPGPEPWIDLKGTIMSSDHKID